MYEKQLLKEDENGNPIDEEPLHVLLTANSNDHLEVGAAMITAII